MRIAIKSIAAGILAGILTRESIDFVTIDKSFANWWIRRWEAPRYQAWVKKNSLAT